MKAITILDNEEFLRQISTPVDIKNDKNLVNDIKILEEYCQNESVLAMAAIQLGTPKRIIYISNTNLDIINRFQTNSSTPEDKVHDEKIILINPVIVNSYGLTEYWEACASCLDNCGRVLRPYKIDLEYYDINSEKKFETFEGFASTVLSHEMDHMDGILHIDIAEEVLVMPREERKVFRQTHGYNIIKKDGDYKELKKMHRKRWF